MKRRRFLGSVVGAPLLASQYQVAAQSSTRTRLASPHSDEIVLLALDPADFPTLRGAEQHLEPAQKHPENPVLRPRPGEWDGTRCKMYGTVLYDEREKVFKMWYSGTTDTPDDVRRSTGSDRHVGYAYSFDGVHWERPNVGVVEFNGTKDNNLVILKTQAPNVFLRADEPDPNRRYLMITEGTTWTRPSLVLYSPDGLRWTASPKPPFESHSISEYYAVLYDPKDPNPDRRWKAYTQVNVSKNGFHGYRGRAIGLAFAKEPETWKEYEIQPIFSAFEGMESEIHIAHVSRFHDTYIMLYDAMEPNHYIETEIAISHDGVNFQRIQNGVKVVPNGSPGEPDAANICVSPNSLFVHEGKVWWYYTISPDTYQTADRALRAWPRYRYTALAHWRQDGFASLRVDSAVQRGEITSRILKVSRDGPTQIWINAVAPIARGGIQVDLVDTTGRVMAKCKPWCGDSVRGKLEWASSAPTLRAGQEVSLRLSMGDIQTRLYSLGINDAEQPSPRALHTPSSSILGPRTDSRIKWTFAAQLKISAGPIVDGHTVYFGSWDQNLYAVDAETGALRWKFETGNAITTMPAVHKGAVYTVSHDGNLYCLEGSTGSLKWKRPVSNGLNDKDVSPNFEWVDSSPVIGPYTVGPAPRTDPLLRLFVGCHNRDLHAFSLDDGTEYWHFPTFNWVLSQPAIDNYTVYFGNLDGFIYAVDALCGGLVWSYRVGKYLKYSPAVVPGSVLCEGVAGSPLVRDDTLYCGADDGFLYALDPQTGSERWVFQTGKRIWGRPLLTEGALVVASGDAQVYGLDPESGKRIWQLQTENANYGNVVFDGKLALVACTSGRLYGIDATTGNVAWTFLADGGLRAGPAVGTNGTLYLPTCKGTIYALAP